VFLGPAILICLLKPNNCGSLGILVSEVLKNLVGGGAYVFPVLCVLLGVTFIVGPISAWSRNAGIGGTLIFLVIISWMGLVGHLRDAAWINSGGIVGGLIGGMIDNALGQVVGKIVLSLIAVIGLYVAIDLPLASLIEHARQVSSAARDRLTPLAEAVKKEKAPAEAPKKNGKKVVSTAAEAEVAEEEKPKRRLLPILVRKGEPEAEVELEKPEQRKIPFSFGDVAKTSAPKPVVVGKPEKPVDSAAEEPEEELGEFRLPPLSLLADLKPPPQRIESELKTNVEVIERTLEEFGVPADVVEIAHGPTVTRYEIRLAPGIKVNKIVSLADNLAMSLAAIDVRVEAPIPGKSAIGVEVPNKNAGMVCLREVVDCDPFRTAESKLTFVLGKDVAGDVKIADLARMPHMLVAGSTNSGKSVCLNALIMSWLYRCTPDELKMILIDPKRVELSLFEGIPHLAAPVVKDSRLAAGILRAATKEMDSRYELIARAGCRNITSYNEKMPDGERLPYLVIVVDELADLMMQSAAEVETSICRIAQLARAVGIHLVIATQRPSVDVVTGLIKANISSRIAFAVSSQIDSRTILDQNGAERLIGRGDMLFLPIDAQKPMRVQGCYVSEDEIHRVVDFLKAQRKPMYTIEATDITAGGGGRDEGDGGCTDELYEQAVRMIVTSGYASTSMIQRKFKIGYTRAARLVDAMEVQGIVGPLDGAKPREVLIQKTDLDKIFGNPIRGSSPFVDDDDDEEYDGEEEDEE
jgi:S-DNA-T family DNA segregation ATPase FtsK/SpoIIIE